MSRELSPLEKKLNAWVAAHLTHVPHVERLLFLDHLRIMIHGGLSIVESLDILHKETKNKKLQLIITDIKEQVETGTQLSEAISYHDTVFPSMYTKMIEAGERAGQLEEALKQVVDQMKKANQLSSTIRGAMMYPAIILTAMGGIGVLMVTMVLPQLTQLFKDFDTELPLATRVLIKISDVVSEPINMLIIISSILILVVSFLTLLRRSASFRSTIHALNLHLPIAGGIIKKINLARFSLTLSSLLKSAIPVVDAIQITGQTCSNVSYQHALMRISKKVKKGDTISESLSTYEALFPPMVTEMVMVGERSGEVESLLHELANFYNEEVNKTMKNFTTIIEPVIIITIGIAVAGMAVAVIMPMFTLVQNF